MEPPSQLPTEESTIGRQKLAASTINETLLFPWQPTGLEPFAENCDTVTWDDIDFLNAETAEEQALCLLHFCGHIYNDECNLYEIAGEEHKEDAKLLVQNANCDCRVIELVLYSLMLLLCIAVIISNTLEMVVILKHKCLRTIPNKFILSLALSDILFAASLLYSSIMDLLITTAAMNYDYEEVEKYLEIRSIEFLCLVLDGPGILFASMMASQMTLMAIAVEKYIAIFHSLKYYNILTNIKIALMIGAIWAISWLFGLLPLMGWNNFTGICMFVERTNYHYLITWSGVCLFAACVTLIIYMKIFFTARKHARQIAQRQAKFGNKKRRDFLDTASFNIPTISGQMEPVSAYCSLPHPSPQRQVSLEKRRRNFLSKKSLSARTGRLKAGVIHGPPVKAIKTIAIILGSFYVCWMPLLIYFLVMPGKYSYLVISWLVFIALMNSLLNPLVYGFRSKSIRAVIKGMCTRRSRRVSDSSQQ